MRAGRRAPRTTPRTDAQPMRRLPLLPLATLALTAAVTPVLIVLPTVARPGARPHAVPPRVASLDLPKVDPGQFSALAAPGAPALGRSLSADRLFGRAPTALSGELTSTGRFDLVAASWSKAVAGTSVQVRVREAGTWTGWQRLEGDDDGPDQQAGQGGATAPLLTGGADGIQVRVDSPSGALPPGFKVDLIDGGRAAADAGPARPADS